MSYVFNPLRIKDVIIPVPLIGGAMGVGGTRPRYTRAFAKEKGIACLSSAALKNIYSIESGRKVSAYEAAYQEVFSAKEGGLLVGMNSMVACAKDLEPSVRGAVSARVDIEMVGAGISTDLLSYIPENSHTAIVIIVSSARTADVVIRKYEQRYKRRPDGLYLEFVHKAGGHLGATLEEILNPQYSPENVFKEVKEVAMKHGNIPVVVGGGIFTYHDRVYWHHEMGADGVVMATRLIATPECTFPDSYKQAVIRSTADDIVVVDPKKNPPGSAGQLPIRISRQSPFFKKHKERKPVCTYGVLLQRKDGKYTECPAKEGGNCSNYLCTCSGLVNAYLGTGDALWTMGANAELVKKMMPLKDIMDKLKGLVPED